MRQDEPTTTPEPPWPAAGLDRRDALRAAAVLAVAAVPLAGCEAGESGATGTPARAAVAATVPGRDSGRGSVVPDDAVPPEISHGPRDRANVALTFHGQGDPAQVRALLDALEQGGARATVLAVGSWLESAPELARRILDGGHELGNHTQHHLDLTSLDPAETFDEINDCALVLRRLTGSIGTWFRPSQTQYSTPAIREQAARVGYRSCLSYDVDSLDNTDPGASAVTRTVAGAVEPGSIVSMHCGHAGTVEAIPAILDDLRGRGLRPVTVTELVTR